MRTIVERIMWVVDTHENGNKSEFARKSKVTPAYISKLGKNINAIPTDRVLEDICEAYGLSFEWLKYENGDPYALNKAEKATAEYLSHAITHSTTAKDAFLRAVAGADDAMLEAVLQFMQRISEEMKEK